MLDTPKLSQKKERFAPPVSKERGGVAGKVTSLDRKNVELKKLANL